MQYASPSVGPPMIAEILFGQSSPKCTQIEQIWHQMANSEQTKQHFLNTNKKNNKKIKKFMPVMSFKPDINGRTYLKKKKQIQKMA